MANQINNSLVLKNTIMLYIRMGLVMIVSLYTSRVLLQALGVVDYGIYNIVGGVVVMFALFNNILTVAIRRFLAIAITSNDEERLKVVFKASVRAVMLVAVILAILMETFGLWLVNHKLNIPSDRLHAANWAFQLSILSFVLNLNALPYNAAIVSFERMNVYAYIGILEVVLKLLFTFCVLCIDAIDKLILYSILFFILSNCIRYIDVWYCRKHIISVSNETAVSKEDVLSIFKFSSWAVLGSVFYMLATQGINITMNLFFGVILNAAMGVSQTVSNAVSQFGGNFMTAFNPPLTKSFAAEGMSANTYNFTVRVTKMTILLMSIIAFPLILNISDILNIWLTEVPQYTAAICVIAILYVTIDIITSPLYILAYADGNVKMYSIVLSIIQLFYVIIFYVACKLGANPVQALSFNILCALAQHIGRLVILKNIMNFEVIRYCKDTVLPYAIPCIIFCLLQYYLLNNIAGSSILLLISKIIIIEIVIVFTLYLFYLNRQERSFITKTIKHKFHFK